MHQKQASGVSFLELLLVFAIAGILVFLGLSQYQRLSRQNDIEAIKYNVDLVRHASLSYYHKHLADQDFDPDKFDTQALCDIWPKLFKTKLIADNSCTKESSYTVHADSITDPKLSNPTYRFTVTITLTESASDWLKNLLNATSASGASLTWQYLPTYSIPTMNTNLWILDADLQQFKQETTDH